MEDTGYVAGRELTMNPLQRALQRVESSDSKKKPGGRPGGRQEPSSAQGSPLGAALARVGVGGQRAPRTAQQQGGRPSGYREAFDRAMAAVSRQQDPRPSFVLARVRELVARDRRLKAWVQENPAVVMMEARAKLPRQPSTPLTPPPRQRKIDPVSVGITGIVAPGVNKLVDRPIAAEAFSGGGLLGCALWLEGVYVSELCEWDEWAVKTLKTNIHEHAVSSDALEWNPSVPDGGLDLLCGGPPCTDFSPARDLGGGVNLVANSNRNLYPRVLEWIADTQPRVVAMENTANVATSRVRGIRRSFVVQPPGAGSGNIGPFFRSWWRNLDRLGYEGVFWVMYAPDYGTPQNRTRAWVIAWPKGAPWGETLRTIPEPTFEHPASVAVASGKKLPWVSAFDRLLSGCCGGYGFSDCINACYLEGACATCIDGARYERAPNMGGAQGRRAPSASVVRRMAGVFERGSGADALRLKALGFIDLTPWNAFARRQVVPEFGDRVTDWLSRAITSNIAKDDIQALMAPPDMPKAVWEGRYSRDGRERRRFVKHMVRASVRDAAKLQDVPNFWLFEGGKNAAFQQVGNGIPVNMGRTVVRSILGALGYPVPIPGTESAEPFNGCWPMDAVDPCAGLKAPVAYPGDGGLSIVDVLVAKDQREQRQFARRRPVIDHAALSRRMQRQRESRQRRPYWREAYPGAGVEDYQWDLLVDWTPVSLDDLPPGFEDWNEASNIVQGQMGDRGFLRLTNHFARVYRDALGGEGASLEDGAALFYRAWGLGRVRAGEFDASAGYPSWSPFSDG